MSAAGLVLHLGDCIEVMRAMGENSVDSIVTDVPAGISFMGKDWDSARGGRDQWIEWMSSVMAECLRVMKPGAHGLVWAIPRTAHWTGMALERAGFEVRDCVTHLFGSGFPKSLDISKAIDKAAGVTGPVAGENPAYRERQLEHDARWNTAMRPQFKHGPGSDAAKQWQGWGTALKPAVEFWWLVRKPLSEKTVAANVLKWGTGGLNIDGCRIGTETITQHKRDLSQAHGNNWAAGTKQPVLGVTTTTQGRFPANLVLDEEAGRLLDEQSGTLDSVGNTNKKSGYQNEYVGGKVKRPVETFLDRGKGGASRFFYCAKASKSERNAGLENHTAKKVNDGRQTPIDNPFQRGETLRINTHPTVKPIKLMQYLIRLITPPGGTVLDPFMGSGSTGVAAKKEGFGFVGIEMEAEYMEIAKARLRI